MKTDKELLELAAKAAGITLQQWVESLNKFFLEPYQQHWNPLTDDGDAMRLAIQKYLFELVDLSWMNSIPLDASPEIRNAAFRRAIVMAVATDQINLDKS